MAPTHFTFFMYCVSFMSYVDFKYSIFSLSLFLFYLSVSGHSEILNLSVIYHFFLYRSYFVANIKNTVTPG